MVYFAKTQRVALWYIMLLMILTISINDFFDWLLYFQMIFSLVILVLLCIRYKFVINNDYLTYQILFFKWPLYKTSIFPHQIKQIKFKRVNWYSKGAFMQVKKGLTIRIVNFNPNDVFKELVDFANKHGIPYSKTKDYIIIEK
ncbi:hypothetical protein A8L44_04330 [Bacillus sp. FJAT-27986]|nr:hypothetical protein A8L44_04330 [Bacillus sp. FJAT-27986]